MPGDNTADGQGAKMTVDQAVNLLEEVSRPGVKSKLDKNRIKNALAQVDTAFKDDPTSIEKITQKLNDDGFLPRVMLAFGYADFNDLKKRNERNIYKKDLDEDSAKAGRDGRLMDQMLIVDMNNQYDPIKNSKHEAIHNNFIFGTSGNADGISVGRLERFAELQLENKMSHDVTIKVEGEDATFALLAKNSFKGQDGKMHNCITRGDLTTAFPEQGVTQDMIDFIKKHFNELSVNGDGMMITQNSIDSYCDKHGFPRTELAHDFCAQIHKIMQLEADNAALTQKTIEQKQTIDQQGHKIDDLTTAATKAHDRYNKAKATTDQMLGGRSKYITEAGETIESIAKKLVLESRKRKGFPEVLVDQELKWQMEAIKFFNRQLERTSIHKQLPAGIELRLKSTGEEYRDDSTEKALPVDIFDMG